MSCPPKQMHESDSRRTEPGSQFRYREAPIKDQAMLHTGEYKEETEELSSEWRKFSSESTPAEFEEEELKRREKQAGALFQFAMRLHCNVLTSNRQEYFFRMYRDCFTGMDAIHWMLQAREVDSLRAAVLRGQDLIQAQHIESLKCPGKCRFAYDKRHYYRFTSSFLQNVKHSYTEAVSKNDQGWATVPDNDPLNAYRIYTHPVAERHTEPESTSLFPSSSNDPPEWMGSVICCNISSNAQLISNSQADSMESPLEQDAQTKIDPLYHSARQRALAALVGAFVAEAASSSLNGVSDPFKLIPEFRFQSCDPAFFDAERVKVNSQEVKGYRQLKMLHNPFDTEKSYSDLSASVSDYVKPSSTGVEARIILHHMAHLNNSNKASIARDIYQSYEQQQVLLSKSARGFVRNMKKALPVYKCAVHCGSIDVLAMIPPIVVLYAGTTQLIAKVNEIVSIYYSGRRVMDAAIICAYILEQIILGSNILETLRKAIRTDRLTSRQRSYIYKSFIKSQMSSCDAIRKFGNEGTLPKGIYTIIQPLFVINDYNTAVRENILGGGRSCRRAIFLGACFAAQEGLQGIPTRWVQKTPYFENTLADIKAVVQRRDFLFSMEAHHAKESSQTRSNSDRDRRISVVNSLLRPTETGSLYSEEFRQRESNYKNERLSDISRHSCASAYSSASSDCVRNKRSSLTSRKHDLGDLQKYHPQLSTISSTPTSNDSVPSSTDSLFSNITTRSSTTSKRGRPPPPPPPNTQAGITRHSRPSSMRISHTSTQSMAKANALHCQVLSIDSPTTQTARNVHAPADYGFDY